jgi:hypothetical protein
MRLQAAYVKLLYAEHETMNGHRLSPDSAFIQHSALSRIRIVSMTANVMTGDRERRLSAGMDHYLSKSLTQGQWAALLTRWLSCSSRQPLFPTIETEYVHVGAALSSTL